MSLSKVVEKNNDQDDDVLIDPLRPSKNAAKEANESEEENDTPIEQVRLTVLTKDDPSLPVLTFRTWVLGVLSCIFLAFVNGFFGYRQNPLAVPALAIQIVSLPIGRLMARVLPTREFGVPFTKWTFSLNPGPFNMKEHVLITIFATAGASSIYAVSIVNIVKAFYKREINPVAAFLLVLTTQMLGYGWAGMFRKYLVDSPYMWWPSNLVQVSLFRALHEKEKRPKGGLTRLQFFLTVLTCSFAYYIFPAFLFQSLIGLSVVCWIWKDSVTAQQIGAGMNGLGIGSFALDWNVVISFLGSPLATPGFAIVNTLAGFILFTYVLNPIAYWSDAFGSKSFPLFSTTTFDQHGKKYNITRILDQKTFNIDLDAYDKYSKLHLSVFFAFAYGTSFAALTATISHVALFNGKSIWQLWKKTQSGLNSDHDIHTRLMKKNYRETPQSWFIAVLISMVALSMYALEGFGQELQLPWWGLLLACAVSFVFTLPIGTIQATTNQQMGLNVITELIIGYIYPGKPLANVAFKTYGYISMVQALAFLQDFKLGHYMKIPPRSMFWVQLISTVISAVTGLSTAWWLLSSIENICDPSMLPTGSPWTCPNDKVFYQASVIWGVIGPLRMFGSKGNYIKLNWFFLIGIFAPIPVWILSRKYPEKNWIRLINMPIIIGATANMPPARAVNYIMWGVVGLIFNIYIYKRYKQWWARHNYVLSAALDAGVAIMGIFLYFALQSYGGYGPEWWGLEDDDHCPLATCPTAPGSHQDGCPAF